MSRACAVVALTCTLPVLLAVPAHAEGELGLSADGVTWHDRLTDPLFDPDVRWVPGDVRTARFFVRNQSADRGALSVDVQRVRRVALIDSGSLTIEARADGRPWESIDDGDTSRLIDDALVGSRRPFPVDVRVSMSPDAPNGTMVLSTDLDFRVSLRDSAVVSGAEGSQDPPGGGSILPATGSAVSPWLPPIALGLIGTGVWLVVRRRRDDESQGVRPSACADLEDQHRLA